MTFTAMEWTQLDAAIADVDGYAPDQLEQIHQLPHFTFISEAMVTGEVSGTGGQTWKTIDCVASSTIDDLHGDRMTEDCVRDMALQARKGPQGHGLTIFLNHKYSTPEDVAGRVISASAGDSGEKDPATGQPIWDLAYRVLLTNNNERVSQAYRQVKDDGISLGISIGAYILEYDYKDKEAGFWGGLIINKVLLVETSIVGIPANQRSWIQNGVMAVGKHIGLKSLFDMDEPGYRLEKRLWKVLDGKEAAPIMKTADLSPATDDEIVMTSATGDADPIETKTDEPEGTPEVTNDAESTPIQESSEDASDESETTETAEETPEDKTSALQEAAPEIAISLEAGTTPAVELVLAALEEAAEQLQSVRAEKTTLEAQVLSLTGERDKAIKDAEFAGEIIALVARAPLGRKTQYVGPVQTFRSRLSGIYDEAFLKLMEQETTE